MTSQLFSQGLRFGSVGLVNTAIGLAVIWAAMWMGISPGLANAIGYAVGLCWSFALHRNWTFRADGPAARQVLGYLAITSTAYGLNLAAVLTLTNVGADPYLAQCAGVAIYAVFTFAGFRSLVFVTTRRTTATMKGR